jgi:hypothetical protein
MKRKIVKKIKKIKKEPVPDPYKIGSLVRYYDGGWYHGYFDGWKGESARIRPIAAINASSVPQKQWIPLTDVQLAWLKGP